MTEEKKKALYKRLASPAFYIALLGAAKLVLNAFGVTLITDDQINGIANGFATLFATLGIVIGYGETTE